MHLLAHCLAGVLAALAAYFGLMTATRAWLTRRAYGALARLGFSGFTPVLAPRRLAPWRWLVIVDLGADYLVGTATPLGFARWQRVTSGRTDEAAEAARRDPALRAYLATCDFPRFRWSTRSDGRWLLVEDVKRWMEPAFRSQPFSSRALPPNA